jgi:hypothetical protein
MLRRIKILKKRILIQEEKIEIIIQTKTILTFK